MYNTQITNTHIICTFKNDMIYMQIMNTKSCIDDVHRYIHLKIICK